MHNCKNPIYLGPWDNSVKDSFMSLNAAQLGLMLNSDHIELMYWLSTYNQRHMFDESRYELIRKNSWRFKDADRFSKALNHFKTQKCLPGDAPYSFVYDELDSFTPQQCQIFTFPAKVIHDMKLSFNGLKLLGFVYSWIGNPDHPNRECFIPEFKISLECGFKEPEDDPEQPFNDALIDISRYVSTAFMKDGKTKKYVFAHPGLK